MLFLSWSRFLTKYGLRSVKNMEIKDIFWSMFEYYTPKIVHIKNKKFGILNRLIQFSIIVYILCYVILWKKGYQNFSSIESSSVVKFKGVVYPNFTDDEFNPLVRDHIHLYRRVWDAVDYSIPPAESNSFFVLTNVVITPDQEQGTCGENPNLRGALCQTDSDCERGHSLPKGNGVFTGKCLKKDDLSTCEILGWCPVELNVNPLIGHRALLAASQNFTVLIKNYADFPLFGIKRRNIPDDGTHGLRCTYKDNPNCPIFVLKDIVKGDYDYMAIKGGAVAIDIEWDCNFDYNPDDCYPIYRFRQLDSRYEVAPGLNFRYAEYYSDTKRTLYKGYGIKFDIFTIGQGRKFNIVPLFLNIGSGIGLLAIATVICDIVVLYCVEKREFYYHEKYQDVNNPDSRAPSVNRRDYDDGAAHSAVIPAGARQQKKDTHFPPILSH